MYIYIIYIICIDSPLSTCALQCSTPVHFFADGTYSMQFICSLSLFNSFLAERFPWWHVSRVSHFSWCALLMLYLLHPFQVPLFSVHTFNVPLFKDFSSSDCTVPMWFFSQCKILSMIVDVSIVLLKNGWINESILLITAWIIITGLGKHL